MFRRLLCRLGFHGPEYIFIRRTGWAPTLRPCMGIRAVNGYARKCMHCGKEKEWWLPAFRVEEWISGGPDGI